MTEIPDETDVPGNEDVLNPPLEQELTPDALTEGAGPDARTADVDEESAGPVEAGE